MQRSNGEWHAALALFAGHGQSAKNFGSDYLARVFVTFRVFDFPCLDREIVPMIVACTIANHRPRLAPLVFVALLALSSSGCQQRLFYAHSLPPQFAAPRITNVQRLDLSRLARDSVKADVIYSGDVLDYMVVTGLEDKLPQVVPLRVAADGTINVPLIGPLPVAGLELTEAERIIHDESIRHGIYRDPQISLIVRNRRSFGVTIVGAVEKPGFQEIAAPNSNLLAAIVAAGGLTKDASPIIEIRHPPQPVIAANFNEPPPQDRTGAEFAGWRRRATAMAPPRTQRINLEEAAATGNGDFQLADGSVVMVMKQPERSVHVMGLVRKPDQLKFPTDQDLNLLDAISSAGGRTTELADKVHIIRQSPQGGPPIVIEASIREAKSDGASNLRLAAGDVVSVEETPLTFMFVTLQQMIRFGFSA